METTSEQQRNSIGSTEVSRFPLPPILGTLALYAFSLLSIGLTTDWRLRHEDNGAVYTTLALSHMKLGLARTRAHDLFFNPHTGESSAYGHHPPAVALLLAAAFTLTRSYSPAVARLVPIAFHIGSLFLTVALLSRFFSRRTALFGGFIMATLPMSAYFGRMVGYEPLCMFAILVQLKGYVIFKQDGSRKNLVWLCFGILLGGLIDWGSFFFVAAITGYETLGALRRRPRSLPVAAVAGISGAAIFAFDVWHMWYAAHGSLVAFHSVLSGSGARADSISKLVLSQLETFRRYFTHVGLISGFLVCWALLFSNSRLSKDLLLQVRDADVLGRFLAVSGVAALAYLLAAPGWALRHHYWQFYFLPFVVASMLLLWQLLRRKVRQTRAPIFRVLIAVFLLDLVITSTHTLHLRHTRVGGYAVKTTASIRERYLSPISPTDPKPAEQPPGKAEGRPPSPKR